MVEHVFTVDCIKWPNHLIHSHNVTAEYHTYLCVSKTAQNIWGQWDIAMCKLIQRIIQSCYVTVVKVIGSDNTRLVNLEYQF